MTLSDLAALGSFVSGLAVAVTLILLLLQMRQSDRNQRASMQLGLATRANDLYARMSDRDFALFMTKSRTRPEELSEVELFTLMMFLNNLLLSWHSSFLHFRSGLLDKASMAMEDSNIRGVLSTPAYRAMWQLVRTSYSPEFCDYVDSVIVQGPLFQSLELAPIFKTLLDEQMAKAIPMPSGIGPGAIIQMQEAFSRR